MKIYIAGPDVFFPDAVAIGEAKKKICARYGFEGHYPFDNEISMRPTPECGYEISRLNEDLIERCDAVIANLSPFRGVSADPGTVFEIGFAAGLGKAVHGYSWDARHYRERVAEADRHSDEGRDGRGHHIENFGLVDNLMIEGAIHRRGGIFIAEQGDNLDLFERVVRQLAREGENANEPAITEEMLNITPEIASTMLGRPTGRGRVTEGIVAAYKADFMQAEAFRRSAVELRAAVEVLRTSMSSVADGSIAVLLQRAEEYETEANHIVPVKIGAKG